MAADDFGGNEDVVVRLGKVAFGVAEKTEALAADLNNTLGEDRLALGFPRVERFSGVGRAVAVVARTAVLVAVRAPVLATFIMTVTATAAWAEGAVASAASLARLSAAGGGSG
jgi:hypothetical protein